MYPNWPVTLHLRLLCLAVVVGGQMFAQPLTKNRSPLTIESAAGQMVEEAALQQHLQQITGSQALAPLLLQLVGQTAPNWQEYQQPKFQEQQQPKQQLQQATNQPQQQQQQRQQQAGQHFFVYEKAAASQQPQILAGFNGVNGRPETLGQPQQQLQQQQLLPKPIQAQQQEQYPAESRPKIVKAPPAAAVWAPALSNPQQQLNQQPPPPLFRAPQTTPSLATGAAPGSCQLCCNPSEPATPSATPCPPSNVGGDGGYEIVPLLSATALKAAVG